jgi:hypothetical protein
MPAKTTARPRPPGRPLKSPLAVASSRILRDSTTTTAEAASAVREPELMARKAQEASRTAANTSARASPQARADATALSHERCHTW